MWWIYLNKNMDDKDENISNKSIEIVSKNDKNLSNENELIDNETMMNSSLPYVSYKLMFELM